MTYKLALALALLATPAYADTLPKEMLGKWCEWPTGAGAASL